MLRHHALISWKGRGNAQAPCLHCKGTKHSGMMELSKFMRHLRRGGWNHAATPHAQGRQQGNCYAATLHLLGMGRSHCRAATPHPHGMGRSHCQAATSRWGRVFILLQRHILRDGQSIFNGTRGPHCLVLT